MYVGLQVWQQNLTATAHPNTYHYYYSQVHVESLSKNLPSRGLALSSVCVIPETLAKLAFLNFVWALCFSSELLCSHCHSQFQLMRLNSRHNVVLWYYYWDIVLSPRHVYRVETQCWNLRANNSIHETVSVVQISRGTQSQSRSKDGHRYISYIEHLENGVYVRKAKLFSPYMLHNWLTR